jgi:hypothetical protein
VVRYDVLILCCCLLAVTACTPGNWLPGEHSLFGVLRGGEFTLHREITIAPGQVRMIFQDGAPAYGYSEFYPHCDLVLPAISDEPQTIPAGQYRIGRVIGQTHYVSRPRQDPVLLAAAGGGRNLLASDSGEWIMFAYHMSLHAETPPERLTLICGGAYNFPYYVKYPSLTEIRESLGDYATLKLP